MSSTIKIHDGRLPTDLVLLFQRMRITQTFKNELEKFSEYELASCPLLLLQAIAMR